MHLLTAIEHTGPDDGASWATLQMAEELVARGNTIDLLYRREGLALRRWEAIARTVTQVTNIDTFGVRDLLTAPTRLRPAVAAGRRTHPDLVWDARYWTLPLSRGVAGRRVPVVCHCHAFPDPPGKGDRVFTRLADRYVAVSGFTRDELLLRGARPGAVRVVHNGIDPRTYPRGGRQERRAARQALGLPADAYVVLTYSRLVPGKGVEVAIDAVSRLDRDAVLVVAGPHLDDGYLRTLTERGGQRTRFLGFLGDVVQALHAADVVLAPSLLPETFGRTTIEALATGRPVVATRVGGVPEVLTGQFVRLLVEPGDVAGTAAVLESLRGWQEREPGLADACVEHVARHFTLARTIDRLEGVFDEVRPAA